MELIRGAASGFVPRCTLIRCLFKENQPARRKSVWKVQLPNGTLQTSADDEKGRTVAHLRVLQGPQRNPGEVEGSYVPDQRTV